jgi:hypothetical protein
MEAKECTPNKSNDPFLCSWVPSVQQDPLVQQSSSSWQRWTSNIPEFSSTIAADFFLPATFAATTLPVVVPAPIVDAMVHSLEVLENIYYIVFTTFAILPPSPTTFAILPPSPTTFAKSPEWRRW